MTNQKKAKRTDTAPATHSDTDTLTELSAEMMEVASRVWGLQQPGQLLQFSQNGVGRVNERLLDDASAMTGRIMEFGNRRFCEDMECMSEFARCRTPEDLLKLQRKWMDTALDDYRKGSNEIYGAGVRLFTDSMKAATEIAGGMFRYDVSSRS